MILKREKVTIPGEITAFQCECFGATRDESIKKISEKIWEAGDRRKGIDYENWKAAEWAHEHFETLLNEATRTTERYIRAEETLIDLERSWAFQTLTFFCPWLGIKVIRTLEAAAEDDKEN